MLTKSLSLDSTDVALDVTHTLGRARSLERPCAPPAAIDAVYLGSGTRTQNAMNEALESVEPRCEEERSSGQRPRRRVEVATDKNMSPDVVMPWA